MIKIQLMNKNNRYNRGGKLLELESIKNHFRQIINPRRSLQMPDLHQIRVNHSLNQGNKFEKQKDKHREEQNQRLYNALTTIKISKGLIELMEEKARQQEKLKKNSNYQHQILAKKEDLRRGNQILVKKIGHIRPRVGSTVQWNQHYENFQKQKKKISRATQNVFDISVCKTNKEKQIKQLFRQTIEFHKSKQNSRKHKSMSKKSRNKNKDYDSNLNTEERSILRKSQVQDKKEEKEVKNSLKVQNTGQEKIHKKMAGGS